MLSDLGQVRLVAERLNVTQPAISKHLAELEQELGTAIVVRVGNRLQFTPVGLVLLKHARTILQHVEQARHETDALRSGLSGTVGIGAVATVMPALGAEFASQLKRQAPDVSINLVEATSDKLFPMLATGDLDIVLSRQQPLPTVEDVICERLFEDPIVIVCGAGSPLRASARVTPADLAGLRWILPPSESPTFKQLRLWADKHGIVFPAGCVRSISLAVNVALLRDHPLLAVMPASLARRSPARLGLKVLRLRGASFLGGIWLTYLKRNANPALQIALGCMPAANATVDRD